MEKKEANRQFISREEFDSFYFPVLVMKENACRDNVEAIWDQVEQDRQMRPNTVVQSGQVKPVAVCQSHSSKDR